MKRFVKYLLPVSLFVLMFWACDDDDCCPYGRWVSYGMVEENAAGSELAIKLDNGSYLSIYHNYSGIRLKDQDRVAVNYELIGDYVVNDEEQRVYPADIYDVVRLLSKPPVKQSFINEDEVKREDSLGYDPIKVIDEMWFGGKYLNVRFGVAVNRYGSSVSHFINVVQDDVDVDEEGYVNLYLRHNGYTDVPNGGNYSDFVFGRSIVSFDISSLVPEDETSVKVRVHWKDYGSSWLDDPVDRTDTGEFKPYKSQASREFQAGDVGASVD